MLDRNIRFKKKKKKTNQTVTPAGLHEAFISHQCYVEVFGITTANVFSDKMNHTSPSDTSQQRKGVYASIDRAASSLFRRCIIYPERL